MKKLRLPVVPRVAALPIAALVLSVVSGVALVHYVRAREARYAARIQRQLATSQVEVVVPKRNLPAGAVVDGATMASRAVAASLLYQGTVTVARWPQYQGRRLAHAVLAGRPLLIADFLPGNGGDFASALPSGLRAFTIEVSGVNTISGLLRPQDLIDVLLVGHHEEVPLLRHIQVLATGFQTQAPRHGLGQGRRFGSITVAVTPRQAAELALAEHAGKLRVVLLPSRISGAALPHMYTAALYHNGHHPVRGWLHVQYIVGHPGTNSIHDLPVGTSLARATSGHATADEGQSALKRLQTALEHLPAATTGAQP